MMVIKAFLMKKLCQIFNTFFAMLFVSNLDISNISNYFKEEKFHSLSAIIEHFEKHLSISNMKNKNFESIFSFKKFTPGEVVEVSAIYTYNNRSSHLRCSVKKCVLRNSAKFTGKHLCQSLFFNKVAGLRPATLLKKRL